VTLRNDDLLRFKDDAGATTTDAAPWKILIVDDDEEVHGVTKLALADFKVHGRPLAFLDAYTGADITHRHLAPKDLGVPEIGHFGFFRERFRDSLWREAADWLAGHAEEELRRAA